MTRRSACVPSLDSSCTTLQRVVPIALKVTRVRERINRGSRHGFHSLVVTCARLVAVILRIIWRGLLNGILRIGCHPADRLGGCPGLCPSKRPMSGHPPICPESWAAGGKSDRMTGGRQCGRTRRHFPDTAGGGHQASFGGQPRVRQLILKILRQLVFKMTP